MIKVLGFYLYVFLFVRIFYLNRKNFQFAKDVLVRYVLLTILICAIMYGSGYQMHYDYQRLKDSYYLNLLPLRIDNSGVLGDHIPKDSVLFWLLNWLITSLYLTFPQAVVYSGRLHFAGKKWWVYANAVAKVYGYGVAIVSTVFVFTSLLSPFHSTSPVILVVAYLILVVWLRIEMKRMVADFVQDKIKATKEAAYVQILHAFTHLFRT